MKLYGSLDNYIQMHRERVGLTQNDLAFLIGIEERSAISQYERDLRLPTLDKLLALEIVFGETIQNLFAGIAERLRETVASRAATLLESLDDTPSRELALKLELLSKLARPDDPSIIPLWEDAA